MLKKEQFMPGCELAKDKSSDFFQHGQ